MHNLIGMTINEGHFFLSFLAVDIRAVAYRMPSSNLYIIIFVQNRFNLDIIAVNEICAGRY